MAHHKRRKRTSRYHKGHCGICQMQSGKGSPGTARLPTPAEMRANDNADEQINRAPEDRWLDDVEINHGRMDWTG